MSAKEPIIAARLAAVAGVSSRVWPILVPEGQSLPAVTYQLMRDESLNAADGATRTREAEFAVQVFAESSTTHGYAGMITVADAIIGDEDATPSGLSKWADGDGDKWTFQSQRDEVGLLESGDEVFIRQLVFTVWYER